MEIWGDWLCQKTICHCKGIIKPCRCRYYLYLYWLWTWRWIYLSSGRPDGRRQEQKEAESVDWFSDRRRNFKRNTWGKGLELLWSSERFCLFKSEGRLSYGHQFFQSTDAEIWSCCCFLYEYKVVCYLSRTCNDMRTRHGCTKRTWNTKLRKDTILPCDYIASCGAGGK